MNKLKARGIPGTQHPRPETDPSILEAYLEDASGSPAGRAAGLVRPSCEAEIATFLRSTLRPPVPVLAQAARSSLTGGAVPRGEVVVSVERMNEVGRVETFPGGGRVHAGPGVRLRDLQRELAARGFYYPPVPTYQEAMLGGTVATNAGGAATFKYGVTRQWVRALRVVLFNGDLLEIERGQAVAKDGESFAIELEDGEVLRVPVPDWRLPDLKKITAGYHAASELDLVDLFVGSEGTLGVVSGITVDLVPLPAAQVTGLMFLDDREVALALAGRLREAASNARAARDPRGPDVRAIEYVDGRSLDLLREHGDVGRLRIRVPETARTALLFEMELAEPLTDSEAQEEIARVLEADTTGDGPIPRLFGILDAYGAVDTLELAFPEDASRSEALREFREAVPQRVNEILARTPGVEKVGGDLIVPFDHVGDMLDVYEQGFAGRGLAFAVWGHLSDGNLHPNALPRDAAEVARGFDALLEFADEATRRGGCPLSEHGVGRSRVKQEMLRRFVGDRAMGAMRSIKRSLDPPTRLAPGVLFSARAGSETG